jgi:hypothetical protein
MRVGISFEVQGKFGTASASATWSTQTRTVHKNLNLVSEVRSETAQ